MNNADKEPQNTVQMIQDSILQRICLLEYKAGDQLKEAQLAKDFGVSRTPVRDAISRIAHLDLVETRNGVGTVVKRLSKEKIDDVFQMRMRLAPLIGELSNSRIKACHKTAINQFLDQAKQLTSNNDADIKKYIQINHELQYVICDLISNSVLRSFWLQTYYQAASVWYQIADKIGKDNFPSLVNELEGLKTAFENNDLHAVGHSQRIRIGYGYTVIRKCLVED